MINNLDFITSVIHSCETSDQIEVAVNWGVSVLKESDTERILKIGQEAYVNLQLDNLLDRVNDIDLRLETLEVLSEADEIAKELENLESE